MMRRFAMLLVVIVVAPWVARADRPATQPAGKVEQATIAVFRLHGPLEESPGEEGFALFKPPVESLQELVGRMNKAGDDPAVKAVVILIEDARIGSGQIEELRVAMKRLRDRGKEVYAHADSLDMRDYTLLSGATRLSLVPTGDLWATGIYVESLHLRGLLDKIGAKPEFIAIGAYKTAAETLTRTEPSPQADEMINWLLDGLYGTYVRLIAEGRRVDQAKARQWIDGGPYTAEKAKAAGLIDAVEYREDFEAMLKSKFGQEITFNRTYGKKKPPQMDFSSPFAFLKIWAELLEGAKKRPSGKPAVAIVYVEGPIMEGSQEPSPFVGRIATSTEIRKALDEATRDDSVKAVVLRVNSPGGSATASEIILEATKRVKARKPLVVSMGDVAGSGGYYVSCGADTIFADEATITASIGVVGGKLVTTDMWGKIGVTFKPYKRGQHAGILSTFAPFTPEERQRVEGWMNEIYDKFKGHVVAIRGNRLKKPIDEIAGGRVFTGRQALELGLVDRIGTLQDAIHYGAEQAKVSEYDIRVVPEPKNFLERLIEEAGGGKEDPKHLEGRMSLMELALPHVRQLDPQRIDRIRHALGCLQLLQEEGAILMMPELSVR